MLGYIVAFFLGSFLGAYAWHYYHKNPGEDDWLNDYYKNIGKDPS